MSHPPPQAGRERAADAVVHAAGLVSVFLGCVLLAWRTPPSAGPRLSLALALYATGLVATFTCSAAYNLAPAGRGRAFLRRADHAAIFLMIAGTYTPVSLLAIGGPLAAALLAVVWTGALGGAAVKLFAPGRFERASVAAYLLLGWVGVVALVPLAQALTPWQFGFLAAGGLLYTVGVLFHLADRLPYSTAVWHALVLVAAGCHFALVLGLATDHAAG